MNHISNCQGPWVIQRVVTSIQQADLPDEWFSVRMPHLARPWSYWLWKPAPVCNFSHESVHFFPKDFISFLRIALADFPLLVCLLLKNICLLVAYIHGWSERWFPFGCIILRHRIYTGKCSITGYTCPTRIMDTCFVILLRLAAHN